jgi:hypothetical protein
MSWVQVGGKHVVHLAFLSVTPVPYLHSSRPIMLTLMTKRTSEPIRDFRMNAACGSKAKEKSMSSVLRVDMCVRASMK